MRIALLGDMQYLDEGLKDIISAFEDLRALKPDLAVFLGDYGHNCDLGNPQAIYDIAQAAKTLHVPRIFPIIGNHDLQRETGRNRYTHGTVAAALCDAFGIESQHNVVEFEDFRLFTFSLEPLPEEDPFERPIAENYISVETMAFLEQKLSERPNVPVIMVTHAQPICGGLRLVPKNHVWAQNAYLNGHHAPEQWTALIRRHPQIVMWFCGHYHLGQFHPGSHSRRYGVDFFLTGVVTSSSRDGMRHTRILDLTENTVQILTFDHINKRLTVDKDYGCPMGRLPMISKPERAYPITWQEDFGRILELIPMGNRIYVKTDIGAIFEIDNLNSAVVGMGQYDTVEDYLRRTDFYG